VVWVGWNWHPCDGAPVGVGAVTRALNASVHHLRGSDPEVVGPANLGHRLDEELGEVEHVQQLGGAIVVGEDVVVVVPTLPEREKRHQLVLGRTQFP